MRLLYTSLAYAAFKGAINTMTRKCPRRVDEAGANGVDADGWGKRARDQARMPSPLKHIEMKSRKQHFLDVWDLETEVS